MIIGPVFNREVKTAPRKIRYFGIRMLFVIGLFALLLTIWQIMSSEAELNSPGALARLGVMVFRLLVPLQLAIAMLFSALLTAASVSLEKDRKTLVLLLMTNLSNSELVLGKLLASLLVVFTVVVVAIPFFMISMLLGGVSWIQILRMEAVTLLSAFVAGSLGSTIALWREKSFQALAMTSLTLVLWLVGWEVVASGFFTDSWFGFFPTEIAAMMSPWQAIHYAILPIYTAGAERWSFGDTVTRFLLVALIGSVLLNLFAILMVRVRNPSREERLQNKEELEAAHLLGNQTAETNGENIHAAPGKVRSVWDNPILWREVRTWAYGKKIILIKVVYLITFILCAAALYGVAQGGSVSSSTHAMYIPAEAQPLVPLLVVSLVLVNALATTSITNERDAKALDLLLVTDITPKEMIFGKLGGVFYNCKEMILLPLFLCGMMYFWGRISGENLVYLVLGLVVMFTFVAMLGIHSGMSYLNSRTAIGVSIGTLLFLFLGIATCMRIMVAFSSSFEYQWVAFSAFMLGGGIGLFFAMGSRNPSRAIGLASFITPFATFYIITTFLLSSYGAVFFVTALTYGFATTAMLVPAIAEFDLATGRTTNAS